MAAHALLAAAMVRLLAKHGGENVVKVLLAVALLVGVLLLTAKVRIVAVLPQLVVFSAALVIFKHFPGFGEIFEPGFGIVFFTDIGVIFACQTAIGGLNGFQIVRWLNP